MSATLVYHDYRPRGAAEALFRCRAPEVLLSGPAGTGKSLGCLQKVHHCLLKYDGARALICRKALSSLVGTGLVTYREKIRPEFDDVVFFGGSHQEPPQFRYTRNGSRLMVGGLDNPTKTFSSEYDLVYVQEATELTENDWELLTRSLRWGVLPYQQIFGDCNPDAPTHWLKRRADVGVLRMLESRHQDNPLLWGGSDWTEFGRAYIARLDALTGARKERLRYGRWVAAEGAVYEEYDRAVHLVDSGPSHPREYVAGVDWGWTNPGSITVYAVDGDGRMTMVYEVYQSHRLIDWWTAQAEEIQRRFRPRVFACDPSEPAFIQAFQRAKLPARPAFNAITPGIRAVQERLKIAEDGRPRLTFVRDALSERDEQLVDAGKPFCTDQEFDSYVWPKGIDGKPLKETPLDADNHGLDTVRYAVAFVDQIGEKRVTGQRTAVSPPRQQIVNYVPR